MDVDQFTDGVVRDIYQTLKQIGLLRTMTLLLRSQPDERPYDYAPPTGRTAKSEDIPKLVEGFFKHGATQMVPGDTTQTADAYAIILTPKAYDFTPKNAHRLRISNSSGSINETWTVLSHQRIAKNEGEVWKLFLEGQAC